jgi:DNA polymerase III subunit chi
MPRVDFYRLTRDPAPRVVPLLAERVLGLGQRLLVVAEDAGLHGAIGDALWGGKAHSFLANGPADGPGAAADPILIGTTLDPAPANGARMILLADGVWRDAALGFERCFLLFDDSRIDEARATWRALAENAEVERHFWKQEDGRWVEGP